jgi:malonyl CoA-acyl carrier protein transacylase
LHAAGVLSERAFFEVARERGRAMAEAARAGSGAMTAVATSLSDLRPRLEDWGIEVVVANDNGPRQVVLSGHEAAIARVEERLEQAGLGFRRLAVATAFHSPLVASCAEAFARFLDRVSFTAPSIAVYSNVEAGPHSADPDSIRRRLAAQIGSPVRFAEMLDAMYSHGVRTFLEVGPGSVLTGLVGQCLAGRAHLAVALDRKGLPGVTAFWLGLGRLAAAGVCIDWAPLWEHVAPGPAMRREKNAFSIKISGTNAGKPYPPPGGTAALPPPNPPRAIASSAPAPTAAPAMAAPSDGLRNGDVAQVHEIYQRALAEAHQKYLATMESTLLQGHTAFLKSMESSFLAVCGAVQGSPVEWPALPPVAADPVVSTPPAAERLPVSTPASIGAPVRTQAAADADPDIAAIVLDVIAEKTGYPSEMLQTEMALESDLGIDSIKRVEILSALQDRVADLPRVEAAEMASLRTIGAVIARLTPHPAGTGPRPLGSVAPTAAALPSIPDAEVLEILRQVVAEKTGYPAEMLGSEMSLEADLGIDSIKRVEILSTLQDRWPALPRVEPAVVAGLRTIGAVAAHLARAMGHDAAPPALAPATEEPPAATEPRSIARAVIQVVPASLPGPSLLPRLRDGRVGVVPDDGGIAEALVRLLQDRGVDAELAPELPSGAQHLLFLAGLSGFGDDDAAIAVNRTAFRCVRQAAGALEEGGLLLLAQDTGGDLGRAGRDPRRAWSAGLAALAKTAAREWPSATVRVVDLERGGRPAAELAAALLAEIDAGSSDVEVGLCADGRRITTIAASSSGDRPADGPALDERSVVVATGGARGITAACLLELARRTRSRFVLLGRTPLVDEPAAARGVVGDAPLKHVLLAAAQAEGRTPSVAELAAEVRQITATREIRATLDAFGRVGASALYCPADTRDAGALAAVLAGVRQTWGPITAVVHGAGVLADKRIAEKTPEQFDRVFDTKVLGLQSLLRATTDDPLRLIALFSSAAAREGNAGQCDYAMANEVLNKVAATLAHERPSCVVKSLGWGPWDGGMVDPSLKAHFAARGVALIPLEAGATHFADEVLHPRDGVEIVIGAPLAAETRPASFTAPLEVDPAHYSWLRDHRIDEVVVVPVMLVLEWFSRAARGHRPDLVVTSCHDLRVLRGISLRGFPHSSERFTIHGRETARRPGATLALDLLSADGTRHYSATVEMQPKAALGAAGDGNGNGHGTLSDTVPLATSPKPAPDLYGGVLFHGPALQVLRRVEGVSAEGIVGTLVGRGGLGGTGSWELDVAALDGGLQLAIVWGAHMTGRGSLPTRIGSFQKMRSGLFPGPVRCVLRGQRLGEHRTLSHIVFEDAAGRSLAELTDVEMHVRAPVEPD